MSLTCQYVWLFLLLLVSISELLSEVDLLLLDSAIRREWGFIQLDRVVSGDDAGD